MPAGNSGMPRAPPNASMLHDLFQRIERDSQAHSVGWGEWITISTATLFALNAPEVLRSMHKYVMHDGEKLRPLNERVDRACLMREVGLKTLGLVGTPKAINNLAALRASVDADAELVQHLPNEPRRDLSADKLTRCFDAGSDLWNQIYSKQADKLREVLAHSHPDLGLYIVNYEYGPLFAPASQYHGVSEPVWEVGRIRMSLVAVASLHAQGGVAPQVISHVYGLLRARPTAEHASPADRPGLTFLTSEEGAEWVLETINELCRVVDGAENAERTCAAKL